jgi:phage recombination protein Bet
MNALTAQTQNTALAKMDDAAIIKVLGDSLYPGAKEASIRMVLSYCKAAGLDPMLKPVHIVPMSVKKPGGGQYDTEWRDVIMPGIGHYRTQASRSGQYVGKSEPRFGEDITKKIGSLEVTFPKSCTITVYRMVSGIRCEFTATELWLENYATAGKDKPEPNAMWRKRPYGQLAKTAEAQALRMAFPELTGGANTAEEMEGKQLHDEDITAHTIVPQEKPKTVAKQLDTFANVKEQPKAQAVKQDVVDIDPETGEVLESDATGEADYPNMPEEALNDWEVSNKWLKGFKWFAMQLPEVFPASRQAFVNRHYEMLKAVSANGKYGSELQALLQANGVKIE